MSSKIVLFLDRNKDDRNINNALKAIQYYFNKNYQNFFICQHEKYSDNDIAILWGIPSKFKPNTKHRMLIHKNQRLNKKPIMVIEKGFIDRDNYFLIGWNNIVGHGFYNNHNMPNDRLDKLNINIKSLRTTNYDKCILLCGQVPWDSQLQEIDYRTWLLDIVKQIKKYSNRKIVYRPHPIILNKNNCDIIQLDNTIRSTNHYITDDLKSAHVVIAYNSNALLDSLIEGVPVFSFSKGSIVYDLANHDLNDIENPFFPSDDVRRQKLADIAYAQWNLDEIKNGEFWKHLQGSEELSKQYDYYDNFM